MAYAGKPSRYTPVTWTEMANGGRESPFLREQRSLEAGRRICKCGHYAHAMPSTADTVYHVQAKHAEVSRARAIGKQKKTTKRSILINPKVHMCETCGISYTRPGGLLRQGCRKHDKSTADCTIESPKLQCGEPSRHIIMGCCSLK